MITNEEVFDDDHLPQRLLHRGQKVDRLANAVQPSLTGSGEDVLISGASGVGKSVLARHTLRHVCSKSDYQYARVECLGETTAGILRAILRGLPGEDPATNTPTEDLALHLRERVADAGNPVAVILDEAADLTETDALARLGDVDLLSTVIVCHNPYEWLDATTDRMRRRLIGNHIELDRLGTDELADVLAARADAGLRRNAVEREQLEMIADERAGMPRPGIQSLYVAAMIAKERGHPSILDQDIADCYERADRRMRQLSLNSLPFHHHVYYELLRRCGPLRGPPLQDRYDAVADDLYHGREQTPVGDRRRRHITSKLEGYNLIQNTGSTKGSEYVAVDDAVVSPLDIEIPLSDIAD